MKADAAPAGPLVSVVIPTYNREPYIAETIKSVLGQTYQNIEVIVIDDGSTDNTSRVVEEFLPALRYVRQENAERGASRNHGLRLSSGKYIAFLDSDDVWLPSKLVEDVAFLEANPAFGLVYSDALQINSVGAELGVMRARGPSGRVTGALLRKNFVFFATHLVRTSLVREIGGFNEDRQLSGAEDWEMLVRLSLCSAFAYNPRVTVKIRTHPDNTMSNAAAMRRAGSRAAELLKQFEPLKTAHKKDLNRMNAHLALANAINYCTQRKYRETINFLKEAFRADPRIALDPRYPYTIVRMLKERI